MRESKEEQAEFAREVIEKNSEGFERLADEKPAEENRKRTVLSVLRRFYRKHIKRGSTAMDI